MRTKMVIGGLCGLLAIGSVANAAVIWDTGDPTSYGFNAVGIGSGDFTIDSPSAGFMTQNTTGSSAGRYALPAGPGAGSAADELVNANGWNVEVRVNATTPTSITGGGYQVTVYGGDTLGAFQLGLLPTKAIYYTTGGPVDLATYTAGFHTFKITRSAGNSTSYDMSVDGGTPVTTPDWSSGTPMAVFGDGSGGGGTGAAVWDYVKINAVPEPASLALLGLGGAALLMRRRRG
ncbi:MAG: PEP-CTERM sorting domain-containing protein [Phycisphaerales bacterium]|nr:PEP-CTERM sorting domain-containing protein [Phycisphaerales bacterium]